MPPLIQSPGSRFRSVTFLTDDGVQLCGTFGEARDDGAISLLLVHDRDADRTVWDPYVALFLSRGWSILTFDLRGHGESVGQETRTTLLRAGTPATSNEQGWPLDVQAALAFLARQPRADPAKRAIVGLGLGADLGYAAAGRGWGTASTVCVSLDEPRALELAGPGAFQPRAVYLMWGGLDETGCASALAFASTALYPAECKSYDDTPHAAYQLWDERQPEIVARSIAWIERVI